MNTFRYDEKNAILTGCYDESIDTDQLHRQIINLLSWKEKEDLNFLGNLAAQGAQMVTGDSHKKVTMNDCKSFLFQSVERVTSMGLKEQYLKRCPAYLNKIKNAKKNDRLVYIESYLALISQYLKINISYSGKNNSHGGNEECANCGAELIDDADCCSSCGLLTHKYLDPAAFIDIKPDIDPETTKIGTGTIATRRDIFKKFQEYYLRWRGITGAIATEDLKIIKSYLTVNHPNIQNNELYWIQNVDILLKTLKKTKNTRYNCDLNLLAKMLWGRELPQFDKNFITILESQWRSSQEIIEELLPIKESNKLISNGWRLWHQLLQAGYECDEKEFVIVTNEKSRIELEKLWQTVCEKMNWNNPYNGRKH